jgi:hypothetical protein
MTTELYNNRNFAMKEIMSSEDKYIKGLAKLCANFDSFWNILYKQWPQKLTNVKFVLKNLLQFHHKLNHKWMSYIEADQHSTTQLLSLKKILKLLISNWQTVKLLYTDYLSFHYVIVKDIENFTKSGKNKSDKGTTIIGDIEIECGQTINALLATPFQRLMRYGLLFNRVAEENLKVLQKDPQFSTVLHGENALNEKYQQEIHQSIIQIGNRVQIRKEMEIVFDEPIMSLFYSPDHIKHIYPVAKTKWLCEEHLTFADLPSYLRLYQKAENVPNDGLMFKPLICKEHKLLGDITYQLYLMKDLLILASELKGKSRPCYIFRLFDLTIEFNNEKAGKIIFTGVNLRNQYSPSKDRIGLYDLNVAFFTSVVIPMIDKFKEELWRKEEVKPDLIDVDQDDNMKEPVFHDEITTTMTSSHNTDDKFTDDDYSHFLHIEQPPLPALPIPPVVVRKTSVPTPPILEKQPSLDKPPSLEKVTSLRPPEIIELPKVDTTTTCCGVIKFQTEVKDKAKPIYAQTILLCEKVVENLATCRLGLDENGQPITFDVELSANAIFAPWSDKDGYLYESWEQYPFDQAKMNKYSIRLDTISSQNKAVMLPTFHSGELFLFKHNFNRDVMMVKGLNRGLNKADSQSFKNKTGFVLIKLMRAVVFKEN